MLFRTPGTRRRGPLRNAPLTLPFLVCLFLATPPAGAADRVELAYGFEAGKTYRTAIETDSEMRLSSDDPETAALLEPYRELRQKVTMSWDQSFSAAEEASRLSFGAKLTELEVSMLLGGVETPVAPELFGALAGMSLSGTMDGKGRLAGVRVESGGGSGAEKMAEELTALSPELPEDPLSPGGTFRWERSVTFPAPAGMGEPVRGRIVATFTLREVSDEQALFDVATELAFSPEAEGETPSLSASGQGTSTFDLKQGFFVSSSMTLQLSRSMTQPAPITLKGETQVHSRTIALAD